MGNASVLNSLFISDVNNLGLFDIFLAFTLPFLLTIPVALFYRNTTKSNNYSTEFVQSLLLFAAMTSIITLLIGSNIARAFGLVAALSLIRFRTALKSTMDAMYLFWALTIGMACGTGFYFSAAMVMVLGIIYMWATQFFHFASAKRMSIMIKATFESDKENESAVQLESIASKHLKDLKRLNIFLNNEGDKVYIFSGESEINKNLKDFEGELQKDVQVKSLEILNSEAAIFV